MPPHPCRNAQPCGQHPRPAEFFPTRSHPEQRRTTSHHHWALPVVCAYPFTLKLTYQSPANQWRQRLGAGRAGPAPERWCRVGERGKCMVQVGGCSCSCAVQLGGSCQRNVRASALIATAGRDHPLSLPWSVEPARAGPLPMWWWQQGWWASGRWPNLRWLAGAPGGTDPEWSVPPLAHWTGPPGAATNPRHRGAGGRRQTVTSLPSASGTGTDGDAPPPLAPSGLAGHAWGPSRMCGLLLVARALPSGLTHHWTYLGQVTKTTKSETTISNIFNGQLKPSHFLNCEINGLVAFVVMTTGDIQNSKGFPFWVWHSNTHTHTQTHIHIHIHTLYITAWLTGQHVR